jgi:transcriptional regulator NrdR family protein
LKKELDTCKNMFLTTEQGEEFHRIVASLTDERAKVEEQYFKVRKDLTEANNKLDVSRIEAVRVNELLSELKESK